jgi:beta-mannosidase
LDSALGGGAQSKWSELVFAVYLFPASEESSANERELDGLVIARHVNFHEPLKEVPFGTQEERVTAKLVQQGSGSFLELRTSVPTKGVYCDFEEDLAAEWADNGVDLVPGEATKLDVKGLKVEEGKSVRLYWLGEAGWQSQVIVLG